MTTNAEQQRPRFLIQEVKQLKGGMWQFVRKDEDTDLRIRTSRVPASVSGVFLELVAELQRLQGGIELNMPTLTLKDANDAYSKRWGVGVAFEMKLPRGHAKVKTEIQLLKCDEEQTHTEQYRVLKLLRRLDEAITKALPTLSRSEPQQLTLFPTISISRQQPRQSQIQ